MVVCSVVHGMVHLFGTVLRGRLIYIICTCEHFGLQDGVYWIKLKPMYIIMKEHGLNATASLTLVCFSWCSWTIMTTEQLH